MTLIVQRRRGPRWLALGLTVSLLTALTATWAVVGAAVITSVPSNYDEAVVDTGGANDINSDQVDLTQFARDYNSPGTYKFFWSWDAVGAWTGSGQTGDACALFDTGSDNRIDAAICARVSNVNADPTDVRLVQQAAGKPVYYFGCNNKSEDRCGSPVARTYSVGQITAGTLDTLDPAANLVTETDPFSTGANLGSAAPKDTSVAVSINNATLINALGRLKNVCSYPSAGSGGNNAPFDCIVPPGEGFLRIVSAIDAPAGTNATFGYTYRTSSTATDAVINLLGGTDSGLIQTKVSTSASVVQGTLPSLWSLQSLSCSIGGSTNTGTISVGTMTASAIRVETGSITTCTFTNAYVKNQPTTAGSQAWSYTANASFGIMAGAADAAAATVTWNFYAGTSCSGGAETVAGTPVLNMAGTVVSATITRPVASAGSYSWTATYGGDVRNASVTTACRYTTISATAP